MAYIPNENSTSLIDAFEEFFIDSSYINVIFNIYLNHSTYIISILHRNVQFLQTKSTSKRPFQIGHPARLGKNDTRGRKLQDTSRVP